MREIKFRAWDKVSKSMRYGAEHSLTMCLMNPNDFELMQYTGLKDKNGVEIYEGDILGMVNPVVEGSCWEVLWHDCGWQILLHGRDDINNYYVRAGRHLRDEEVIGNVHENEELLLK